MSEDTSMNEFVKAWSNRVRPSLGSIFGGRVSAPEDAFDPSRRAMLSGLAAAVACGAVVTMFPSPAGAQDGDYDPRDGDYDNDDHSRRRSRRNNDDDDDGHGRRRSSDDHGRRRSRRDHGRGRSRGHGRRRSRREYRDWNDECFPTAFGWVCF